MKKIFTLFAAIMCAFATYAADVHQWYVNNTTEVNDPENFVTHPAEGKWNLNTNYKNATYVLPDGTAVTCNKGLKMEGSTDATFTTATNSTVIVVQCTSKNPTVTIKFDGAELTDGVENPTGCSGVKVFTVDNVAAGEHHVTRGNGESGIMYIGAILEEAKGEQLATPEISFNETTGEVTIAPVANATKVVYTTDGSYPTEESTVYTAPFTVADGTTVKAMAIGDGENYSNSSVAEVEVFLAGFTCEAPVINQFNGTFALTTTTALASCEYSLDGTTWVAYTHPVTFFENTTVKARTVRANWTTSDVVEAEIVALPLHKGTKTVYLGAGAFEIVKETADKGGVLKGLEDGVAAGYSIEINVANKGWGKGSKVTVAEGVEYTTYYGSNGAQNVITLPEGIKVYRVTFYSYMPALGRVSGWNEVNGETLNQYKDIPLLSQDPANPDVRVFNLDGVTGSFTFAQTGERPNFMMALEVVEGEEEPEPEFGDAELAAPASVYPFNNSKMLNLAGAITLTFDAEVQTAGKATLNDKEAELVANGNEVYVTYAGLEPLTEYTLTIPAGAIGNAEAQNKEALTYTFTTRMADVLYYADFNCYPEGLYNKYGYITSNTDIIAKGSTDVTVEVGGMTFFSGTKGRVVAMTGVCSTNPEADYGPYTEEDTGATTNAVQLIDGGSKLYVEFPEMEGPVDVTFWLGNPGTSAFTVKLCDENGDTDNPLTTFELPAAKKVKKFTYTYPYKGAVKLRLYNMGKKVDINDALFIKGEGEGIDKPDYSDTEAPVLTYSWPSAAPYSPVEGNIVLVYNEDIVATATPSAKLNDTELAGVINGKTVTFAYSGLEKGKTYTVEIPAVADEAGNATQPFTMTLATEAENVLYYTDYNYFPYSYWDAFHIYPIADGADNGDILAKNSTNKTVEFGGITYSVGATAGRVVAMGKSNLIGTGDETLGASPRCAQFSGGGNDLYAELPAMEGPCEITLLLGNTNNTEKEFSIELRNAAASTADAIATFTITAEKKMFKFDYKFTSTQPVQFRLYNMGNQFNLHDILVVKTDEGGLVSLDSIEAEQDVPAVYYNLQGVRVENPAAGLYIRVRGNNVDKVLVK